MLELYPGGTGAGDVVLELAIRNRPAAWRRLSWARPVVDPDGRRVRLREAEVFAYVGPDHVLEHAKDQLPGVAIETPAALAAWLAGGERSATWTVGEDGLLRLAPLHSEHVACAGFAPVLAAGVISFVSVEGEWEVDEITNQSTGFCPHPGCWEAVEAALDLLPVAHPGAFTHTFDFRRCTTCDTINIIKDGVFLCSCGAPLSPRWNFDEDP